jgi:pimeloyl-ACP methyl ester carboxylesterase
VPADYYAPVASDVPALVLSGEVDPVTPPSWGAEVASHLSRALHVTAPATGHGVLGTACGERLVAAFVSRGVAEGLDTSCMASLRRPPFFLAPAGPDPGGPRGSAP